MGTKNKPGEFDCYDAAEDDEPMFVLLARDPIAPDRVEDWAHKRFARLAAEQRGAKPELRDEAEAKARVREVVVKIAEALACARAMRDWYRKREEAKCDENTIR